MGKAVQVAVLHAGRIGEGQLGQALACKGGRGIQTEEIWEKLLLKGPAGVESVWAMETIWSAILPRPCLAVVSSSPLILPSPPLAAT